MIFVVLLGLCAEFDQEFNQLRKDGAILNEYIVAGRYPGDLAFEVIERSEAEEAISIVLEIRKSVLKLLIS
ncbi:MAG: HEPN domain-containing protein [Deltaproteobacteria bacterium]|nr:HEPN domain-containing protein [Deltaproteobacteria bacterium]